MVNGGVYIKRLIEDGAMKEDFQIELLDIYSKEECLLRETELAKTSLFPKGLNGNAGRYIKMTEEVCNKISEYNKGKKRPHTEKWKTEMSASKKGKPGNPHTQDTKNKLSSIKKGYTHSEETKSKIGASLKGRSMSEVNKEKRRKPHSEEHKRKISESLKR